MKKEEERMKRLHIAVICAIAVFTMAFFGVNQAGAASKAELDQKVRQALDNL